MKKKDNRCLPDFLTEAILCHLKTEPSHAACFFGGAKDFRILPSIDARCATVQLTLDFAHLIQAVSGVDPVRIMKRRHLVVDNHGSLTVDNQNVYSNVTDLVVWKAITRALKVKGRYGNLIRPEYSTWGEVLAATDVGQASIVRRLNPHLMLARQVVRIGRFEANRNRSPTGPRKRSRSNAALLDSDGLSRRHNRRAEPHEGDD